MAEYMYTRINPRDNKIVDFRYHAKERMWLRGHGRPVPVVMDLANDRAGQRMLDWYIRFIKYYDDKYDLGMRFGQLQPGGKPRTRPEQFQ